MKIIFGSGGIGERALSYFGKDNVSVFVDNDVKKYGTFVFGKKVISFEEMIRDYSDDELIIATLYYSEIILQLKEKGIDSYKLFLNKQVFELHNLFESGKFDQYNNIVIYGDNPTYVADIVLKEFEKYNIEFKIKAVAQYIEPVIGDARVLKTQHPDLEEIQDVDYIIVVDSLLHRAMVVKAQNLGYNNDKIFDLFESQVVVNSQLLTNKYLQPHRERSTEEEQNKLRLSQTNLHRAVNAFTYELYKDLPFVQLIEMEVINRCNGVCSFCPVNKNSDTRPYHEMDEQLFKRIVGQLKEVNYQGAIDLFGNSEPLLHPNIIPYYKHLREELPDAYITMLTNGTLLTIDMLEQLLPNLDYLLIDNYNQELNLIKPVEKVKEYCEQNPDAIKKVRIDMRKPREILNTRAGNAPNRKEQIEIPNLSCTNVFQGMLIRPTGEVSLCCNDALGEMTLGDLRKEHINDVWYGEKYDQVRQQMLKGRTNIELCRHCDNIALTKGNAPKKYNEQIRIY